MLASIAPLTDRTNILYDRAMSALTPSSGTQEITLLSGLGLPSLARPLAVIGDHTYAAIWAYFDRGDSTRSVAPQLLLVRDDGRLLDSPSRSVAGLPQPNLDW